MIAIDYSNPPESFGLPAYPRCCETCQRAWQRSYADSYLYYLQRLPAWQRDTDAFGSAVLGEEEWARVWHKGGDLTVPSTLVPVRHPAPCWSYHLSLKVKPTLYRGDQPVLEYCVSIRSYADPWRDGTLLPSVDQIVGHYLFLRAAERDWLRQANPYYVHDHRLIRLWDAALAKVSERQAL